MMDKFIGTNLGMFPLRLKWERLGSSERIRFISFCCENVHNGSSQFSLRFDCQAASHEGLWEQTQADPFISELLNASDPGSVMLYVSSV